MLASISLLGKLVWLLANNKDKSWVKILLAKYVGNQHILKSLIAPGNSCVWRSVVKVLSKLRSGFDCRIGNGESIRFCDDLWAIDTSIEYLVEKVDIRDNSLYVNDVVSNVLWDFAQLHSQLMVDLADVITSLPISMHVNIPNSLVW